METEERQNITEESGEDYETDSQASSDRESDNAGGKEQSSIQDEGNGSKKPKKKKKKKVEKGSDEEEEEDLFRIKKPTGKQLILENMNGIQETIAFLDFSFERAITLKEKSYIAAYKVS